MAALNLFPSRVRFVNDDGTLTSEAYRTLQALVDRTGGVIGDAGADTFSADSFQGAADSSNSAGDVVAQSSEVTAYLDQIAQPSSSDALTEMVMQPQQDRAMTAPESVSVGASPFTFMADRDGFVVVAGGTVSQQEYGRGTTFTNVGLLTSMLPIMLGDSIRVTYSAAPAITFIPR